MEIGVNVVVKPEDKGPKYDMSLSIPTSMSADKPFLFEVKEKEGEGETSTESDVMLVAIGDEQHVCVKVRPPQSLTDKVGKGVIEELAAIVEEGTYDEDKHTFTDNTPDTEK